MSTNVIDQPSVRVRSRKGVQPVAQPAAPVALVEEIEELEEIAPIGEVEELTPEEAKTKAKELVGGLLALKEASNKAIAAAAKAEKELAKFCAQHSVPSFAVKLGEKVYDVGEVALKEDVVDPTLLFDEIGKDDALTLFKVSQGAVVDYGGKPLLAKVLKTITKPLEFKVRKRSK